MSGPDRLDGAIGQRAAAAQDAGSAGGSAGGAATGGTAGMTGGTMRRRAEPGAVAAGFSGDGWGTARDEARRPPTRGSLARRRLMLIVAKGLLPVVAVLLLASVAMWPEINRVLNASRMTLKGLVAAEVGTGRVVEPRYRGVDDRGRPYTVTADSAVQDGPERVNLVTPKGDVVLQNGAWLMLQSKKGVYMQHAGQLDLQGDVTLYRQDGTVMTSDTADIDLHQGAAASNEQTHAEGPFGVLDAQGFVLVDKGSVIQFQGPAHMVLNGGS